MKFTVPHNWQHDLIPGIRELRVEELYAKLPSDFVGGGRASYTLPRVSKKRVARIVSDAHKRGIRFNYLLNATCLGNREWTIKGQRRLLGLLDWLAEVSVDAVTVSIPYLMEVVKKRYPRLSVCVSTQAGVNTIRKAKHWEELGADRITLAEISVNRNFPLLRRMRQALKCELQLIANLDCLYECPFSIYHSVLNSHGSQDGGGFLFDYCTLACNYIRLKDPVEFIRAGWIRPEDVRYYEDAGIDSIKLVNRTMTTGAIILAVEAYTKGRYDGNLLDLFSRPSKSIVFQRAGILHKFRYFFRPFSVNILALLKARSLLGEIKVHIDNRSLDGFIEHFLGESCDLRSCDDCGYCSDVAKRSIRISPAWHEKAAANYKKCLDTLLSGDMFSYSRYIFDKKKGQA
ncbi:MAG: U32 family peptidase [Candidatus Omnitrophota bacterium]|jgi:collagenase-like PrtC family protease